MNDRLMILTLSCFVLPSCSPSATFSAQNTSRTSPQAPRPAQETATDSKVETKSSHESVTVAVSTLSPEQKSQECWFAVSGTYVSYGDYEDTFPNTKTANGSGKPFQAGGQFDTVGGVFLAARSAPYIYDEGGQEIDKAVDYTFDGIVVPPGMLVDIRPSADATPLFSGQGPLIAVTGGPLTYNSKFEAGELKHWPQWMQDVLKSKGRVESIPRLHEARWVKVSTVPGSRCSD
jgi:hypothetical protein